MWCDAMRSEFLLCPVTPCHVVSLHVGIVSRNRHVLYAYIMYCNTCTMDGWMDGWMDEQTDGRTDG